LRLDRGVYKPGNTQPLFWDEDLVKTRIYRCSARKTGENEWAWARNRECEVPRAKRMAEYDVAMTTGDSHSVNTLRDNQVRIDSPIR
jgi:hypothetical protein